MRIGDAFSACQVDRDLGPRLCLLGHQPGVRGQRMLRAMVLGKKPETAGGRSGGRHTRSARAKGDSMVVEDMLFRGRAQRCVLRQYRNEYISQ